jgi:flagellin-like protein
MKGVSEIIAIILILMIVVALAALAYTWFSGIFSSLTTTTSNATTTTASAMSTNFRIETAKNMSSLAACCNVTVTLRCLGTTILDVTKMSAYINDVPAIITVGSGNSIPSALNYGNFTTFNITTSTMVSLNSKLRLIAATGLEQSAIIT